jgi:hypothetical protein
VIGYMDNVASRQALALLKAQGIRLIAGPVLGLPSEMPGPVAAPAPVP